MKPNHVAILKAAMAAGIIAAAVEIAMVFDFMPHALGDLDGVSIVSVILMTPSVWLVKLLALASSGAQSVVATILMVTITFLELCLPTWLFIWWVYARRKA